MRDIILDASANICDISSAVNQDSSKHQEITFKGILDTRGAQEISLDKSKIFRGVNIRTIKPLDFVEVFSDGIYYIHQPFGSQQNPDFIIFYYGVSFFIECKSSKSNKIMWNCGISEMDWIYIINVKNFRGVYLGKHFIKPRNNELMKSFWNEAISLIMTLWQERKLALEEDDINIWEPYILRKMNEHKCKFEMISNPLEDVLEFIDNVVGRNS